MTIRQRLAHALRAAAERLTATPAPPPSTPPAVAKSEDDLEQHYRLIDELVTHDNLRKAFNQRGDLLTLKA